MKKKASPSAPAQAAGGSPAVFSIEGMTCENCERAILRAVSSLPGLTGARADFRRGTLSAVWDEKRLPFERIEQAVLGAGYRVKKSGERGALLRLSAILLAVAALYICVAATPLGAILSDFPLAQAGMGLGSLFAVGLMTSVHCVAMCGGINLSQSASAEPGHVLRANLLYQAGRVLSYTAVGALVGALGSVLSISDAAKGGIQLFAAAFMLIMALNLLGGFGWARRLSLHLPRGLSQRLARATRGRSSLIIGLAGGLMPCGPLQAMQLCALAAGSALMGGLSMLAFALGTVPLMLAFGLAGGRLNARFGRPMRLASGALVLLMGVNMLFSGLTLAGVPLPGALASPFAASSAASMASAVGGAGNEPAGPVQVADGVPVIRDGVQYVHTELSMRGYPAFAVYAGVPAVWTLHADAQSITGCNGALVIPAYGVQAVLSPGDNVIEFTPGESGIIPFYCWMGMIRSAITVLDAPQGDA